MGQLNLRQSYSIRPWKNDPKANSQISDLPLPSQAKSAIAHRTEQFQRRGFWHLRDLGACHPALPHIEDSALCSIAPCSSATTSAALLGTSAEQNGQQVLVASVWFHLCHHRPRGHDGLYLGYVSKDGTS